MGLVNSILILLFLIIQGSMIGKKRESICIIVFVKKTQGEHVMKNETTAWILFSCLLSNERRLLASNLM